MNSDIKQAGKINWRLKGRARSLVGGLASLLIVAAVLGYRGGPQEHDKISLPTTQDEGAHGLQALFRWLHASDVPVAALRHRMDALLESDTPYAAKGPRLLVTSWPGSEVTLSSELTALDNFVKDGNQLLLLVAAHDQPLWARHQGSLRKRRNIFEKFDLILGVAASSIVDDKPDASDPSTTGAVRTLQQFRRDPVSLDSATGEPLFGTSESLMSRQYPDSLYHNVTLSARSPEKLWPVLVNRDDGRVALYRLDHGDGVVWISMYPELFSNATLGEPGNASFITSLISRSISSNGLVVFDDFHFGESDLYDDKAFFRDGRLHKTLLFLGGLWLLWIVGRKTRLAPLRRATDRPSVKRLIQATGGLYARMLAPTETSGALIKHFQRDVRQQLSIDKSDDLWAALDRKLGSDHAAMQQLKAFVSSIESGRKPSLLKLSRAISQVRRDLA